MYTNNGDPDLTHRFAASDLGLHCLPVSYKKDAMLTCYMSKSQKNRTFTLFT